MRYLFHHLLTATTQTMGERSALVHKGETWTYQRLNNYCVHLATALQRVGLSRHQRVAVYLPKQPETVATLFATTLAGGVFVPINPVLKPPQVGHILNDCNVRVLVTNTARAEQLLPVLANCPDLRALIVMENEPGVALSQPQPYAVFSWSALLAETHSKLTTTSATDTDMAAVLYTSGSTGKPKGVVLSHRNLVVGADSVSSYLGNQPEDRILAALPLSFDAGLSQITTAFASGASVYLLDYLLPNDVLKLVRAERISALTAVPPLWHQLANLCWDGEAGHSLRYFANTGGHMPRALLEKLRAAFPNAKPYLMYGLTEAFRSTYLDPDEVDRRPDSIGQAIPNAEILVLREDGSACEANEVGELVHRGPLVSQGYWNDPQRTAERFRPIPAQQAGLVFEERAVWSGDQVRRDEAGYLYFVGRRDEMIKTSGYRVSPGEIEEVAYQSGLVREAVALGVPHETLGQAILLLASAATTEEHLSVQLLAACRSALPNFMVPQACLLFDSPLPRNPNGKFDRRQLADHYADYFL